MKIASKTFLLGEYAILNGAGIVLAHSPFFTFSEGQKNTFHSESLAGKYLSSLDSHPSHLTFQDPHHSAGGFGGSGAEFVGLFAQTMDITIGNEIFAWKAWEKSRALGESGSGADILTQAYFYNTNGGALSLDIERRSLKELPPLGLPYQIFHTQKKLATHEHLSSKPNIPPSLLLTARAGIQAAFAQEKEMFLKINKEYSLALQSIGLLAKHSAEALQDLPPNIPARACGAMGSDVIVVFASEPVREWAHRHNLKFVCEGLI